MWQKKKNKNKNTTPPLWLAGEYLSSCLESIYLHSRMIRSGKGVWNSIVCEVTQSCPTLCDPMDCSLPGSLVRGIFQARVLEWVAISFSRGDLPNPGIKPGSPSLQADAVPSEPPGGPVQHFIENRDNTHKSCILTKHRGSVVPGDVKRRWPSTSQRFLPMPFMHLIHTR